VEQRGRKRVSIIAHIPQIKHPQGAPSLGIAAPQNTRKITSITPRGERAERALAGGESSRVPVDSVRRKIRAESQHPEGERHLEIDSVKITKNLTFDASFVERAQGATLGDESDGRSIKGKRGLVSTASHHPMGERRLENDVIIQHNIANSPQLYDERGEEGKGGSASPLPKQMNNTLTFIQESKHSAGAPFLGSVDVRRTKHVIEMLDFGKEEYGMIGDNTDLFPESSKPLDISDILSAVTIDGPDSLKTELRQLITEYRDIFSNDVGETPALVEPMKLTVTAEKWSDSTNRTPARPLVPIGGRRNPPSGN
jgi:hypothetical protein